MTMLEKPLTPQEIEDLKDEDTIQSVGVKETIEKIFREKCLDSILQDFAPHNLIKNINISSKLTDSEKVFLINVLIYTPKDFDTDKLSELFNIDKEKSKNLFSSLLEKSIFILKEVDEENKRRNFTINLENL